MEHEQGFACHNCRANIAGNTRHDQADLSAYIYVYIYTLQMHTWLDENAMARISPYAGSFNLITGGTQQGSLLKPSDLFA